MSKSSKLYKDSPSIKKDEEGSVGIHRPSEADAEDMGLDGEGKTPNTKDTMPVEVHQANERREVKHRHVNEHLAMHHRHELEHAMHGGDKKELHKKHETEHKEMHKRHEDEVKSMHSRHEKAKGKE